MSSNPLCAVCGHKVAPDTDHVKIEKETVRMDDRNDLDDYYLHVRCAENVTGSWERP